MKNPPRSGDEFFNLTFDNFGRGIEIHSSTGGDAAGALRTPATSMFQSTPPAWGAIAVSASRLTKQQESCSIVQWPSLTEKRRGGSSISPSNSKASSPRSRPRRPDLPKIRIPTTCRPGTAARERGEGLQRLAARRIDRTTPGAPEFVISLESLLGRKIARRAPGRQPEMQSTDAEQLELLGIGIMSPYSQNGAVLRTSQRMAMVCTHVLKHRKSIMMEYLS